MKKMVWLAIGIFVVAGNLWAADGDLIVNGSIGVGTDSPAYKLDMFGQSVNAGREAIMKVKISDAGADAFFVSNNTATNGRFVPEFMGYRASDSVGSAMVIAGSIVNGLDSGANGVMAFQVKRTDGDPLNGILTPVVNRPAFVFNNFTTRLMTILPEGDVGIGAAETGGYRLYVNGPAYSTGGWQSSDLRYKQNLERIESPLMKIMRIDGVSFDWKTEEYQGKGFPKGRHFGVVAQQLEGVMPEAVKEAPDGEKAVAYTEIIPVLIEAIKEQQRQIEKLKVHIVKLQEKE